MSIKNFDNKNKTFAKKSEFDFPIVDYEFEHVCSNIQVALNIDFISPG